MPLSSSAHLDPFCRDNLPPRDQWPVLTFPLPQLRYPARLNCARALLDDTIDRFGSERPALHEPDGPSWSYGDLRRRADQVAHVLIRDLGLVPGNRVLLRGPNTPWLVACWLGVLRAGCVVVTTMPLLRAGELAELCARTRPSAALCDARFTDALADAAAGRFGAPAGGGAADRADPYGLDGAGVPGVDGTGRAGIPSDPAGPTGAGGAAGPDGVLAPAGPPHPPPRMALVAYGGPGRDDLTARCARHDRPFTPVPTAADDVALLAPTSGTTGRPKITMHFHRDVLANADTFAARVLRPRPDDVFTGTPPLAFTFGLGGLVVFPLRIGASVLLLERPGPDLLADAVAAHRATVLFTAPTAYRALLASGRADRLAPLRRCVSAGEPLPAAVWHAFHEATGARVIDGIGATELLHVFIASADREIRPGSTGRPVPGYTAAVLDPEGRRVPDGTAGRLAVVGPTGCRYLADARQHTYVQHGWNITGDTYVRDRDGYFHHRARSDDMIISAGYNIAGPEVEQVLLGHQDVLDCGVVGAPDRQRGHVVTAFVVARAERLRDAAARDALRSELQDFVKQSIAPYKYPRRVEFVAELPRTASGKLQRFRLRETAAAPPAAGSGTGQGAGTGPARQPGGGRTGPADRPRL